MGCSCGRRSYSPFDPQEYYHYKSNWWLRSNKKGSNTVPVEHRPDFKQALSALQQLKQKEEGAQRNQQWVQSTSSSSRWSWQGSWWTPHSYESHHGDEPSTDRTGRPVECSIWKDSSEQDFLEFNLICYRWIVYSWRRSSVTDGVCKFQTSNDVFSRCKSVHKISTRKSDDELMQLDNKMRIGTRSGKFRKVENPELSMTWWHSMTRTPMTTSMIAWHCMTRTSMTTSMIAWHITMRTPLTTSTDIHMSVARTVSHLVLSALHHPHTHRDSSLSPFTASTWSWLDSPFLFPALLHVPYLSSSWSSW